MLTNSLRLASAVVALLTANSMSEAAEGDLVGFGKFKFGMSKSQVEAFGPEGSVKIELSGDLEKPTFQVTFLFSADRVTQIVLVGRSHGGRGVASCMARFALTYTIWAAKYGPADTILGPAAAMSLEFGESVSAAIWRFKNRATILLATSAESGRGIDNTCRTNVIYGSPDSHQMRHKNEVIE
jgi:hypothetical protein